MTHRTFFNGIILGKIGTGKTTLSSILTNPLHDDGTFYFLDPAFVHAQIRTTQGEGAMSFIDTNGLVGNRDLDMTYLRGLNENLTRQHYKVTSVILCIRYGRVKSIDLSILDVVLNFIDGFGPNQVGLIIVVSGIKVVDETVKNVYRQVLRTRQVMWVWLDVEVSRSFDEYGGRWISNSDCVEGARNQIFNKLFDDRMFYK